LIYSLLLPVRLLRIILLLIVSPTIVVLLEVLWLPIYRRLGVGLILCNISTSLDAGV
jgi:hypothetical protein